jgi:hypothetical protein
MIDNNWNRRQVINLWIDGYSQDEIAKKMGISVGKVNGLIQQFCVREEPVARVRDMVVSASKNGIDMNQLNSNLRYANALKKFGSDHDKFESLFKGLEHIFGKNESNPDKVAELIYQITEIAYKEQKSLSEIRDSFNSKIEQDRMLEDKIKRNVQKLKSNNVTTEELQLIKYLKNSLSDYNVPEVDKIINFINNVREADYDPAKLIQFASNHSSISQEVESIKGQKIEELTFLADTEMESSLKRQAIHTYEKLSKKGYSEQGIADFLEVLDTMIQEKKGGQNGGNSLIGELRNDLTTYGSLLVAKISLMYENNDLAFRILQSKKMLQHYQATQY